LKERCCGCEEIATVKVQNDTLPHCVGPSIQGPVTLKLIIGGFTSSLRRTRTRPRPENLPALMPRQSTSQLGGAETIITDCRQKPGLAPRLRKDQPDAKWRMPYHQSRSPNIPYRLCCAVLKIEHLARPASAVLRFSSGGPGETPASTIASNISVLPADCLHSLPLNASEWWRQWHIAVQLSFDDDKPACFNAKTPGAHGSPTNTTSKNLGGTPNIRHGFGAVEETAGPGGVRR
jgi:hypothetical protein